MSATVWFITAIVGFSLSGIAFVTAAVMFFKMNIPSIIGDLNGKTVAKEMKELRANNLSTGDKSFRPSRTNMDRGMLTEKVIPELSGKASGEAHKSKRLDRTTGEMNGMPSNERGDAFKQRRSGDVFSAGSDNTKGATTGSLSDYATEVLSSSPTDALFDNTAETVNGKPANAPPTSVLTNGTGSPGNTSELELPGNVASVEFRLVRNYVVTHSEEVI